ncbi:MAG: glucodextranase DOMON-like domain-containing protein [Thermoanaerobaculia bacterium]
MKRWLFPTFVLLAVALVAGTAFAQEVSFKDPSGDDKGPGTYVYPTDKVYKSGSFDLVEFKMKASGDKATFSVTLGSALEDPWGMGGGFATQMVFVFIDTDGKEGSGFTKGLPGLNVAFAPADAWDRCVILSPQPQNRVASEVETKAAWAKSAVLVPTRTRGAGRTISGTVSLKELGEGDPATWGYQVVVQSNEGFPDKADLLTRKVNEYEGQHRFGGGTDGDCDPHVMDILAGKGTGDASEVEEQKKALAYECEADGTPKKTATLPMVRR